MPVKNIPSMFTDSFGFPIDFRELLIEKCISVSGFAKVAGVSRQCVYKYINGLVNPDRIPYNVVTDWCQILDVGDMQLYNAMVTSFEEVHRFNEETGKWE